MAGDAAAGEAKADVCASIAMSPPKILPGPRGCRDRGDASGPRAGEFKHSAEIKDLAEEDIADVAAWFAHEGGQ
jgi:hypothetical protein